MVTYQNRLGQVLDQAKEKSILAKRVDIVSMGMLKESSLMHKERVIGSPADGFNLLK